MEALKSEFRLLQHDWGVRRSQQEAPGFRPGYLWGLSSGLHTPPPDLQTQHFSKQRQTSTSLFRHEDVFFSSFDHHNVDSPDRILNIIQQKSCWTSPHAGRGLKVAQKVSQKQKSTATSIFHHLVLLHLLQQETVEQSSDRVISTSFLKQKVCWFVPLVPSPRPKTNKSSSVCGSKHPEKSSVCAGAS